MNFNTISSRSIQCRLPAGFHSTFRDARSGSSVSSTYRGSRATSGDRIVRRDRQELRILGFIKDRTLDILDELYHSPLGDLGYFADHAVLNLKVLVFSSPEGRLGHLRFFLDALRLDAFDGRLPRRGFHHQSAFPSGNYLDTLDVYGFSMRGVDCNDTKDQVREILLGERPSLHPIIADWRATLLPDEERKVSAFIYTGTL